LRIISAFLAHHLHTTLANLSDQFVSVIVYLLFLSCPLGCCLWNQFGGGAKSAIRLPFGGERLFNLLFLLLNDRWPSGAEQEEFSGPFPQNCNCQFCLPFFSLSLSFHTTNKHLSDAAGPLVWLEEQFWRSQNWSSSRNEMIDCVRLCWASAPNGPFWAPFGQLENVRKRGPKLAQCLPNVSRPKYLKGPRRGAKNEEEKNKTRSCRRRPVEHSWKCSTRVFLFFWLSL